MHRTTVLLPKDLKASAEAQARRMGISLGELIRRRLKKKPKAKKAKNRRDDPVFQYYLDKNPRAPLNKDTATDAALNHDKYLTEAMEAEIRRWR